LVSQLQWLQKAEQVIKPDENNTTTNTLRHLSDILKEGTELADNKCMLCCNYKLAILWLFNFSDDRDLQLTETSNQNWQKMGTKGSRSFRN